MRWLISVILGLISVPLFAQSDTKPLQLHNYSTMIIAEDEISSLEESSSDNTLFNFAEGNNRITFGCGISSVNNISSSMIVINLRGFYWDYHSNIEGNHHSNMGIEKYNGYNISSWHIGYTIPITSRIAVTPLVGKIDWEEGYYDGSNWGVTENGIVNEWVCTDGFTAFDFGVNARYDVLVEAWLGLSIFAKVTKYSYGFGFEMAFLLNDLLF